MRRTVASLAAALAAALVAACGDDGTGPLCSVVVQSVELTPQSTTTFVRIGDGALVDVSAFGECDLEAPFSATAWSSSDSSVAIPASAFSVDGEVIRDIPEIGFVQAVGFGSALISARVQEVMDTFRVEVSRPDTRASGIELLGGDSVSRRGTDVWVHGDYAYSGTTAGDCGPRTRPCESVPGALMVWRLGPDGLPALLDSVQLPGPRTNDVKVSPRGDFLVVSQESNASTNGVVLLDLADPAVPTVVAHFTDGLENGVHNVWVDTIGGADIVFVAENGSGSAHGLHILDVTDRASPTRLTRYVGRSSSIHDVYVRDGLAFVSHWDDGLVILDVGNGVAGGTPAQPADVGSIVLPGGNTHNAWYWPARGLVFVGEESFPSPIDTADVGQLHVVDVSDLGTPRRIGGYRIPGNTPHNFWLDEEGQMLYVGWYGRGVRAFDVSGELPADLGAREVGFLEPSGSRGAAWIWAPQLHRGVLYLSDPVHGVWAARPVSGSAAPR